MYLPSKTDGRLFYGLLVVGASLFIFTLIGGSRYCLSPAERFV
jgi:hypothetical protein